MDGIRKRNKRFQRRNNQQNLEDKYTLNCSLFIDIFEDNIKIDDLVNKFNHKVSNNKLKLNVKKKAKESVLLNFLMK